MNLQQSVVCKTNKTTVKIPFLADGFELKIPFDRDGYFLAPVSLTVAPWNWLIHHVATLGLKRVLLRIDLPILRIIVVYNKYFI